MVTHRASPGGSANSRPGMSADCVTVPLWMICPLICWLNVPAFLARFVSPSSTSGGCPALTHDRDGAAFQALSFAERLVVWDGEHDAAAAADAEAKEKEAALAERRASEASRALDIAQFLADNPGVDISSLRPRVFPGYTYLPGQERMICRGERADRCLATPECRFRYRAGFFTRQGATCPWCGEPLPADLGMARERSVNRTDVAIDHIIPLTRGGLVHAEWNKQLLHRKCNISKGNLVTGLSLGPGGRAWRRGAGFPGGLPAPGAYAARCGSAPDDATAQA